MAAPQLFTFADAIDRLVDYAGGNVQESLVRDAKRSVMQAMLELANEHKWNYYKRLGRISVVGPQSDGTVDYDHTGGAYERLLTLTDSTWPTWVRNGVIRIGVVDYEVAERIDDTRITLSITSNPGADLDAGTTYVLYRDTYPIPADAIAIDSVMTEDYIHMENCHPRDWMQMRRTVQSTGAPRIFCIAGDPNLYGAMAIRIYPYADHAQTLDFIYQGRMRQVRVQDYATGTVTVSAGSTTVTGTSTAFPADCAGSIIRFSADAQNVPEAPEGTYPYAYERVILSRDSGTQLTIDASLDDAASVGPVRFRISDPIDIEPGVMQTCFMRLCEKALAEHRTFKDRPDAIALYRASLADAKAADERYEGPKLALARSQFWSLPITTGADVP